MVIENPFRLRGNIVIISHSEVASGSLAFIHKDLQLRKILISAERDQQPLP